MDKNKALRLDLTLALILLTSVEKDHTENPGQKKRMAWTNYELSILRPLENKGLIKINYRNKKPSFITITPQGMQTAEELIESLQHVYKE